MGALSSSGSTPPERLSPEHDLSSFDSGEPFLDEWLRRRSLQNELNGASRTYVACAGKRVVGFYCLAAGAVAHSQVSAKVKRNMPDPVPVMVIGRLAVDKAYQGRGLGVGLLRDAILRTIQVSEIAGIRAILIHAKTEAAKRFYERSGFRISPTEPLTVMITIEEARKILEAPGS